MIESIFVFFVTFCFIYSCSYIDYEHLKDNDWIESHTSRVIQRGLFVLLIALYNYRLSLGAALLFTALFDQMLNYLRVLPLFHLGTTAKWDIFFNKHKWLYITVKVIAFFGSIALFFYGKS